jgi:hypothetical protein
MIVKYAVTFEFDTRPPVTTRGTVAAFAASTCTRLAVKEAQTLLRPVNWTSMVCVLLERVSEGEDVSEEVDESDSLKQPI